MPAVCDWPVFIGNFLQHTSLSKLRWLRLQVGQQKQQVNTTKRLTWPWLRTFNSDTKLLDNVALKFSADATKRLFHAKKICQGAPFPIRSPHGWKIDTFQRVLPLTFPFWLLVSSFKSKAITSPLGEDVYVTDTDQLVLVCLEALDLDYLRRKILRGDKKNGGNNERAVSGGSGLSVHTEKYALPKNCWMCSQREINQVA